MPNLNTALHLKMLQEAIVAGQPASDGLYGLHWGDPDTMAELTSVRDKWLLPHVASDHVALEIGPGGGRWTRYMLPFQTLYAVDYHQELLDELGKNFAEPNIVFIKNNGTDFPGIPDVSVDFLFSFGVFVHLDIQIIRDYLDNLRRVLKPDGTAVIQYSDKDKPSGLQNPTFSFNNPRIMRALVTGAGYAIVEEDTTTLWHSSIVRFTHAAKVTVRN